MRSEYSLEDLHERLEQLLRNDSLAMVSQESRRHIADKFANKSLQELNDIALNLPPFE